MVKLPSTKTQQCNATKIILFPKRVQGVISGLKASLLRWNRGRGDEWAKWWPQQTGDEEECSFSCRSAEQHEHGNQQEGHQESGELHGAFGSVVLCWIQNYLSIRSGCYLYVLLAMLTTYYKAFHYIFAKYNSNKVTDC